MNEIKITIPFNHDRFVESQRLVWRFLSKGILKKNIWFAALSIMALFFSLGFPGVEDRILFASLSGGSLYYIILRLLGYYERKRKFFKITKALAARFEAQQMDCSYHFAEHYLAYEDKEKGMKMSWALIKTMRIFEDTIFLISKDNGAVLFTIGKETFGVAQFTEISEFLKKTIG